MSPNRIIVCSNVTVSASGCVQCWTPDFVSISVCPVHIEKPGKIVAVAVPPIRYDLFYRKYWKIDCVPFGKEPQNMQLFPVVKGSLELSKTSEAEFRKPLALEFKPVDEKLGFPAFLIA